MKSLEIRDEREEHERYAAYLESVRIGFVSSILVKETVLLPHVEVDPDRHDLGIGSLLVRRVFDDARAESHTVLALCPFARRWVHLHPGYEDVARVATVRELEAVHTLLAADRTMRHLHMDEEKALHDEGEAPTDGEKVSA